MGDGRLNFFEVFGCRAGWMGRPEIGNIPSIC
jgi:hypothetical protein